MNLVDGEYYDATIIGVTYGKVGEKDTPAFRFAVRMDDGTQQEVLKFASPKALKYTRENLEELGCTEADLTGEAWLRKINQRLGNRSVRVKAEKGEKGVRLSGIFPRSFVAAEEGAESPFGAAQDIGGPVDDLGPVTDDMVPY